MKTVKNLQICPLQIFVRPEFALNFCYTYFNWIFHPQGVTFWQFFAVRAHIRIFLAFRICINFYSILKIEPARPHLPPKNLGAFSGQEIVYIGNFLWIKTWHFLHFVNLWPEGVIRDHFTTLRAWKTIDQAFQRHLNFWPRSHCLSTQGRGIQCTKTLWWEEVFLYIFDPFFQGSIFFYKWWLLCMWTL